MKSQTQNSSQTVLMQNETPNESSIDENPHSSRFHDSSRQLISSREEFPDNMKEVESSMSARNPHKGSISLNDEHSISLLNQKSSWTHHSIQHTSDNEASSPEKDSHQQGEDRLLALRFKLQYITPYLIPEAPDQEEQSPTHHAVSKFKKEKRPGRTESNIPFVKYQMMMEDPEQDFSNYFSKATDKENAFADHGGINGETKKTPSSILASTCENNENKTSNNLEENKEQTNIGLIANPGASAIFENDQNHMVISSSIDIPGVQNENQTNQSRTNPDLRRFYEPEVKIYMIKNIGFFLIMTIFSILCLLFIHSLVPVESLVTAICFYQIFFVITDTFWKKCVLQELWIENEGIFDSLDTSSGVLTLFLLYLKSLKLLKISIFASIPFPISTLIYIFLSESTMKVRFCNTLIKFYYCLQILLITLKVDTTINWSWEYIFLLSWIFLLIKCSRCLIYGRSLLKSLFARLSPQNQSLYSDLNMEIIGSFWYFCLYGLSVVAMMALLGTAQILNQTKDLEILSFAAYLGIGLGSFLVLYTVLGWKPITKFVVTFGLIESFLANYAAQSMQKPKRVVAFEAEKKANYFVKLSSTYFMPLKEGFIAKSNRNVQKVKNMLNQIKSIKPKFMYHKQKTSNSVDVKTLREYKEKLDQDLKKIATSKKKTDLVVQKDKTSLDFKTITIEHEPVELTISPDNTQMNRKRGFSVDSIPQANFHEGEGEELLCYLCYVNVPDAVLVNCGHGGICYECAQALVKKKDECMECRKKIEAIYRIDPNSKVSNIIKGIELNKVVISN